MHALSVGPVALYHHRLVSVMLYEVPCEGGTKLNRTRIEQPSRCQQWGLEWCCMSMEWCKGCRVSCQDPAKTPRKCDLRPDTDRVELMCAV